MSFEDQCTEHNATAVLLSQVGDANPRIDDMGVFTAEEIDGTIVRRIEFGQLYHPDESEWSRYSTVEDDELAKIHAMLHVNQARVLLATHALMQRPGSITVFDSYEEDAIELASASSTRVLFRGGDASTEFQEMTGGDAFTNIAAPPTRLSDTERAALWEVVAEQEVGYSQAALGSLEAVGSLRSIDLADVRRNLCILMGAEAILMAEAIESGEAVFSTLFPYLALEQLLFANEYLQVMTDLLSEPDVDWLEGPNVDLAIFHDEVTTVGEYVGFLQSGAMGAISEYRALTQDQ